MARTKSNRPTTAREWKLIVEELDTARGALAMVYGDLDATRGGHDVGDDGATLRRIRRALDAISFAID